MAVQATRATRSTERVAILMTPQEKETYMQRAQSMGLSLGQFFRQAGEAYREPSADSGDEAALIAALELIESSTARAEQALDQALAMVRASNLAMDREPSA
jgi:hypothetical protein